MFAKQEAREEGLEQGIKEGIKEGSLQERKILLQNMLKHGITYEQISNITELSKQEIQLLIEEEKEL